MAIEFGRLRRIGASARNCIVAGALACALAPGLAFAADDLVAGTQADDTSTQAATSATSAAKQSDKLLAKATTPGDNDTIAWPDGYWKTYDAASGKYVWSTYVKGDGGHYGHYALDIAFEVKENVLESVNVTSPDTAIGGSWSNYSSITGYLPQGVTDSLEFDTDAKTVKPTLTGADTYGSSSVTGIAFYAATKDGDKVTLGDAYAPVALTTATDRKTGKETTSWTLISADKQGVYSYNGNLGKAVAGNKGFTYSEPDAENQPNPNVVAVTYKIGDWYSFLVYYDLTDAGYSASLNAFEYAATPSGIGSKNRDMWTQMAVVSIIEQQLGNFVGSDSYEIDIVSSATKSSDAVIEALYAAQGIYYPISNNDNATKATAPEGWKNVQLFTSLSDNLQIKLDGKAVNSTTSGWRKDDAGNYVLKSDLTENFDFTQGTSNRVNIVGYDLFDMSASTEADVSKWLLSHVKTAYGALDDAGKAAASPVPLGYAYSNNGGGKEHLASTELTAEAGKSDAATYDPATNELTITDPHVTHAIVWYNHDSHGNYAGVVYDLGSERMQEVTELRKQEREAAEAKAKAAAEAAAAKAKAAAEYQAAVNPNAKTLSAAQVKKASDLGATTITLGKNVKKIAKNAFKGTKVKTVVITSTKLKKSSVKNAFKGSKVKTVKVNVGSKKQNKKFVKKYKKFFTKAVLGKSVKLKAA